MRTIEIDDIIAFKSFEIDDIIELVWNIYWIFILKWECIIFIIISILIITIYDYLLMIEWKCRKLKQIDYWCIEFYVNLKDLFN